MCNVTKDLKFRTIVLLPLIHILITVVRIEMIKVVSIEVPIPVIQHPTIRFGFDVAVINVGADRVHVPTNVLRCLSGGKTLLLR